MLLLRALTCSIFIILAGVAIAPAQIASPSPPPPWPTPPGAKQTGQTGDVDETIRVETDLVDLNVSVFSRDRQRIVGPLSRQDFAINEDGVPQEISFFASADTPFDLVLLIDLSGSTADKLKLIKKSATRFVETARPTDRIGIVTFTEALEVVSPLTSDREQLKERIKRIRKPKGGTNFWDALRYTLDTMLGDLHAARRSAVVLMTDGVDNALPDVDGEGSRSDFTELLEDVKRSDAIVLPIYLDTEREMVKKKPAFAPAYAIARRQLALLAEESGSIVYQARRVEDLNGVYEQVIHDLGTVYSIGYRPTNRRRDGTWRNVSIKLPSRPDLAARTKRGYYAARVSEVTGQRSEEER